MPQLIWTESALQDLARLHAFLRSKNPQAAQRAIAAIRHGVRVLGELPMTGRPAADPASDYREWPIGFGASGYMALYRIDGQRVVIVSVRHGRELAP